MKITIETDSLTWVTTICRALEDKVNAEPHVNELGVVYFDDNIIHPAIAEILGRMEKIKVPFKLIVEA